MNEVISNSKVQAPDSLIHNPSPELVQEEVHYRVVSDDELLRLTPLFTQLGWDPPDPNMAKVVVVEAGLGPDAIILGFGVVEFIIHAGPLWMHPSMRGTGIAEALGNNVVHYIEHDCKAKKFIAIAKPGSFAARICEANGMVPTPGQLYTKKLK